jgi:hypothetical protein
MNKQYSANFFFLVFATIITSVILAISNTNENQYLTTLDVRFFHSYDNAKNFIETGNVSKEDKYYGAINKQREGDKVFAVINNNEIVNGRIKKYKGYFSTWKLRINHNEIEIYKP